LCLLGRVMSFVGHFVHGSVFPDVVVIKCCRNMTNDKYPDYPSAKYFLVNKIHGYFKFLERHAKAIHDERLEQWCISKFWNIKQKEKLGIHGSAYVAKNWLNDHEQVQGIVTGSCRKMFQSGPWFFIGRFIHQSPYYSEQYQNKD